MSKVFKIGITDKNNKKINEVKSIEVLENKGVVGDRHFDEFNDPYCQLSLIESENIDFYNSKYNLNIPYVDFRRNIITEGVKLNQLIGKEFFIGEVKVKAHDLCRPCKYLQETLNQKNIIKEFLHKGGLRCEILIDGKILVGDKIKY